MTIHFDLEKLRKSHDCSNYFETGLWDPRTNVSSKTALSCEFEHVFCIELRDEWIHLGKKIFESEITKNRFHLIHDDSVNMQNHLNNESNRDKFLKKTVFFLDAHVDNAFIQNYKKKCPLLEELEAIKQLERKDHVILIDDLRIIENSMFSGPWGETSYSNMNMLQKIKEIIISINPKYKFSTLPGHVENDVLFAYV